MAGGVPIDRSPTPSNLQATVQKALSIQRAALGPADPSSADRQIAARTAAMTAQARQELSQPVRNGMPTLATLGWQGDV